MLIFVTDEGRFWNHKNPILEKYADCVIVICLNGEAVTDKYKCIVSPYKPEVHLGMTDYSVLSQKYKALKSIEEKIREEYYYHDDLVFLTDGEPQSLYPYLVLKDDEEFNKLHLWCMSPWRFESKKRRDTFFELVHDIDKLNSIHYVDADEYLKSLDRRTTMPEAIEKCQEWLNSMLPGALYEIDSKLSWGERYYYDLKAKRYISTDKAYSMILKAKPIRKKDADEFIPFQECSTLGLICEPDYPDSDEETKESVEQLHPRLDGKQVCEKLKQMRKQLAEANGIKMEFVDCPSTGPCAGTCERCDMEVRQLQEKLFKIKEEDRRYPQTKIVSQTVGNKPLCNDNPDVLMGVPVPIKDTTSERKNEKSELKIPIFLKKSIEDNKKEAGENE